ncbi:MAG: ATP-binding cassette domain-containing protein [Candidatus Dactylopiibacterium sp.]|nr:ATP-binding cassette domain-containing protein [Candidatus Dactylopiibacterium sp.]
MPSASPSFMLPAPHAASGTHPLPAAPAPGALAVSGLRYRFAGQAEDLFAIDALTLAPGATLGIQGASGAGKTTLLHCLAGIETAHAGSIRWGDTELARRAPPSLAHWRQRGMGLVFQDFHLVEGLSARHNVLLPAQFTAWRADAALRRRADALLERVGLDAPARRAEQLSRGERQRVAVARALLFAPPVLLADEPTASLDPDNRARIGELLLELAHEHGATLVAVSHDEALLARLDRVLTLRAGTLSA